MSDIQVNRGETKLGVFSEEEIKEGLRSGRFLPSDIAWRQGMANWVPLSEFPGIASTEVVASGGAAVAADGLPWERRQEFGFFPAFFETLKLVLLNPTLAFASMRREGGLGDPLLYALIGGSIGAAVGLVWQLFFSSVGSLGERNPVAALIGTGVGAVICIVLVPLFLVLFLFIGAGILHLCLMLVGGANRSFETTFRVVSYSIGSTNPLAIVPFCGGMVAFFWNIVLECIGLAKAHETTTGKAVLAVLLPLIVCCGAVFLFWVVIGVGVFSALSHHSH
jgi:hypothetical protein